MNMVGFRPISAGGSRAPQGNAARADKLTFGSNIRCNGKNRLRRADRKYLLQELDIAIRRLDENLRLPSANARFSSARNARALSAGLTGR